MDPLSSSTVQDVQRALARGEVAQLRHAVLALSNDERDQLSLQLGERSVERMTRAARGARRGRKRGRVVVLHGIMGSLLDAVDAKGDVDRIWLNYARLILGRIADLELDPAGKAVRPVTVRTAGLMQSVYAPLVLELDRDWHVLPFAYDWRQDIDHSADRLRRAIASFSHGDPVHLVAHSMGGLVARRFLQRHPQQWASMQGPDAAAGGRLVMLGTPNRGSYAIPLALSGNEKLVKWLARFDTRHDRGELLRILNTFAGSYQMLPSPVVDLPDDHLELFGAERWGDLPIQPQLLQRAKSFLTELEAAIDPERFVYVAGYDRPTPFLIRVTADGSFELQRTREGDGRVPHRLGLLPDVPTFWVDEGHGDLPKNDPVLDAIDELLAEGDSSALLRSRPTRRRGVAEESERWIPAEEIDPLPKEAEAITARARRRGTRAQPEVLPGEAAELQALLLGDYLGGADVLRSRAKRRGRGARRKRRESESPTLEVEVCWGDITKVHADVYAVGHYQGIEPQNAEKALDEAVSGLRDQPGDASAYHVIREHTRRGSLRGNLGDIYFFPWRSPTAKERDRVVAIAGMGTPGSFGLASLRRLTRELTLAIDGLPHVETVCTVLIGSGAGTLSIPEAVEGLVQGLADAVATRRMNGRIRRIRVVELARHRALAIRDAFQKASQRTPEGGASRELVHFDVKPELELIDGGGEITTEDALSEALAAIARAALPKAPEKQRLAAQAIVARLPRAKLRERVDRALAATGAKLRAEDGLHEAGYRVEAAAQLESAGIPTRISIFEERELLRAAAITHSTTVAERVLPVGLPIVEDLVEEINDPDKPLMDDACSFVTRLLFPSGFRDLLKSDGPFVFEVDRVTAQMHWELLAPLVPGEDPVPLSTRACVARQLRTQYAPAPEPEQPRLGPLRALVIGDPGDPRNGDDLPGARREALAVHRLLDGFRDSDGQKLVEVTSLIGAPGGARKGIPRSIEPATLVGALRHLMHGRFDLLHYCGHGDFDPEDPTRVGWIFDKGPLTAREIQALDEVPSLIVANACLSGRTSHALDGGGSFRHAQTEAGLLPSLADQFFRMGVRNYVGTAWEVSDLGAIRFASDLYAMLLFGTPAAGLPRNPTQNVQGATIGEAVREARAALYAQKSLGKLWAAYQHYGDPTVRLRTPEPAPGA